MGSRPIFVKDGFGARGEEERPGSKNVRKVICQMVPHEGSWQLYCGIFMGFSHSHIVHYQKCENLDFVAPDEKLQEGSPFYSAPGPWPINNVVLVDLFTVSFQFPLRCRKMVHIQRHSQRLGGESME